MTGSLTRREFLKLVGLSFAGVFIPIGEPDSFPALQRQITDAPMMGRVTRRSIDVRSQPDPASPRLYKAERDTLLHLLEEVSSSTGPPDNPRWYRLSQGYVHSAHIQRVEQAHLNIPLRQIPQTGLLAEVTVPYTQTIFTNRRNQTLKLYRLYYQSVHWITALVEGPDGSPWYRLSDERLRVHYDAPAAHLRPLPTAEFEPYAAANPEMPRHIEVSLADQMLFAYEGDQLVFHTRISSGRRYMETPTGEFVINRKYPSKHMGDGGLTSNPNAYELVGVPWVSFFHTTGVAFHGTFWHDNFGTPMSQGCVNMRNEDARWLFRWSSPAYPTDLDFHNGRKLAAAGTRVIVR
jgi:lipoprotein-anchoring transpeptidase ErfK/SrfK